MRTLAGQLTLGIGIALWMPAQEGDVYQFLGSNLNVVIEGEKYPLIGVDERAINYRDADKDRSTTLNAICSMRLVPAQSTAFVRIENLKPHYTSRNQMRREADSIRAAMDPLNGISEIVADKVNSRDFDDPSVADTLDLAVKLTSSTNIEGAYCAIVIQFPERPVPGREPVPAGAYVRAHYIGDLVSGEIREISLRKTMPTFPTEGTRIGLFIFDEEGRPVANSHSPRLQIVPLTTPARK